MRKHFGVYGIIIDADRILLVHKARGPYTGMLDLVGGTPETNETAKETLIREVAEESGIVVQQATYLAEYQYHCIYQDSQNREVDFTHTAQIYQVDAFDASNFNALIQSEDVAGAAWLACAQLSSERLSPIAAYALTLINDASALTS